MKSESEIRNHLNELRIALALPCDCATTNHESECASGREMVTSAAVALEWVLGEGGHEAFVVDFAENNRRWAEGVVT